MRSSSCSLHGRSVRSALRLAVAGLAASCAGVEPADGPASEATRAETARDTATTTGFLPVDPLYPLQWSYPQIGLPDAWAITRGSATVRIAIFDSGTTGHPDLDGRFELGRDFVDGHGAVDIGTWHHGTHVAGILGARTSTSPAIGGAGICSGCKLIPIRLATASGELDLTRFAQALHWAVGDLDGGKQQAEIVNLSMNVGTTAACPTDTAAAVQYAINHGVVVVNSAGNFGGGAAQPANCPGIISVAATQRDKTLAAYTSRGNVTLAAPGGSGTLASQGGYGAGVDCAHSDTTFGTDDGVLSSWAVSPVVSPSGDDYCYRYLSGTSMAAPHVAGTIGLMLSAQPEGVTFTPAQITRLLVLTAEPIACAGTTCGAGLLDARAAVTAASRGGVPRLGVTPPSFLFDPLRVGASSVILTVVATSTGVGPVTISSFELTGAGAAQFQIDFPGCAQSCTGPFTIPQDTAIGFRVACRPKAAGFWSANLVFHNNSSTGDVATQLSCTATAPELVVDTASIDFLVSHLGTPAPTRPVHLTNAGSAPLSFQARSAAPFSTTCISGCTCSGSICSGTVPPSGTAALAAGYTPSALGLQSGTLTITSDDPSHPAVPISLRGTGGIGTGSLAPLAFGDVQVGSAAVGALTLTNTGGYPLTVTAIDLTDAADFELAYASGPCAGATHCTVAQQAATTLAIPVRCHPAAHGALTSQVTLSTDGAPAQVTAQLTCNGTVPMLQLVAPASGALSFVAALNRTSAPRIVTIASAGDAPLHISSAVFSGAATSALQLTAPGLPLAVAPGSTVDFSVTCTPTWSGASRTAQLTFTADVATPTSIAITCSTLPVPPPNPLPDPPPAVQ